MAVSTRRGSPVKRERRAKGRTASAKPAEGGSVEGTPVAARPTPKGSAVLASSTAALSGKRVKSKSHSGSFEPTKLLRRLTKDRAARIGAFSSNPKVAPEFGAADGRGAHRGHAPDLLWAGQGLCIHA